MADDIAKTYAGQPDITNQFAPGTNIKKTLGFFKRHFHNGDYTFGDLTVDYYTLTGDALRNWKSDVNKYPKDAQEEIKRHIIYAMTRKDQGGHDDPTTISFEWKGVVGDPQSIACTYTPGTPGSPPSYKIVISGYPKPQPTPLAERKGKY
jgi:hypothetical protein